jgi:hypothetical protein
VESGTHRELLALQGIYAKLAAMQFFANTRGDASGFTSNRSRSELMPPN